MIQGQKQYKNDKMPEWGSLEFETIAKRARQLTLANLVELILDVAKIDYGSKNTIIKTATKEELINVLDEARSKNAVLTYLERHGV